MKPPILDPEDDTPEPIRPMTPLDRRRLRSGQPSPILPPIPDDEELEEESPAEPLTTRTTRPSRQDLDPVFGYILAMALSVGLTPIPPNTRFVVLWAFLAMMGGMAFLLGSGIQLKTTDPGDLVWGMALGLLIGGALMVVGADTLVLTSERLFDEGQTDNPLLNTWIFQATVFVMPLAEGLFFRGAMQRVHPVPVVALLASVWSMLLFFPDLGLGETPAVGFVMGTALLVLNFLYSFVSFRHGLAASFVCQAIAGTLILLVPRLASF